MSGTVGLTLLEDKEDECCNLDYKTRLIGGAICTGVGVLFTVLSFITFATSDLSTFAIIYSIGTILAVAASFFFLGPKKHFERMKSVAHMVSSVILIVAIILVFIGAFAAKSAAMAIIFVIVQIVALVFFYITLKETLWRIVKGFFGKFLPFCK